MKTVKKLSSIILSIIIAFSLPVCTNAAEGKFVSVSFETLNSDGEKEKTDEVLYTDGTYLYANPELFEEYTAYDYDEDNNAFVRAGQDFKLSLSSTTIDYKNKKATVKMMNSKHTFDLHNIFKFGNDYYLPLDQIAAYLKAEIKVDGTTVTVINSGYSVADAAYDFNEFKYILNYENIVDEIFGGSETAYRYYTVLYYFSSTIFGLKVSNLIGPVGDISNYKTALQKIVTDNTDYIKTQADPNSLTKRLNDASTFIKNGKEINDKLKDATTVMTTAYESFCDTDDIDNLDIDYIDAKNWGEVFGKLKTFYNYTDYAIKYISMTEDNKNMLIDAYGAEDKLSTYKLALGDTTLKFGDDAATSLCSKALDILVEDVPKTTVKTFAEKALPALALVKGTAAFFKLLGFDLTDNSSYSIMLDSNIAHNLTERYTNLAETAGKTKDDTEAFRKAGIFATLAMKNAYNSGNKLNKKVNGQSGYYNKKIEEVALRAQLFYRAAESKGYDDLNSISSHATKNQKNIADSKITSKAKKTTFNSYNDTSLQFIADGKYAVYHNQIIYFDFLHYNKSDASYHGSIVAYDVESGKKKILVKNIMEASLNVYNDKLYYNDIKNSCIYSYDLKNNKTEKIYKYESLGASSFEIGVYRYAQMMFTGNKMIVTLSSAGHGDESVTVFDLTNKKTIFTDNSFDNEYEGTFISVFTYKNNLYYLAKNNLYVFDLNNGAKKKAFAFDTDTNIISQQKNIVYYITITQTDEYSYYNTYYSLDLRNYKCKKIEAMSCDEPLHDIFIYNNDIYALSGTGAGDGFIKWKNGEWISGFSGETNYQSNGSFHEKFIIYKNYICAFSETGFHKLCKYKS